MSELRLIYHSAPMSGSSRDIVRGSMSEPSALLQPPVVTVLQPNRRGRRLRWVAVAAAALVFVVMLVFAPGSKAQPVDPSPPRLSSLSLTGGNVRLPMWPNFDAGTFHYAIGCEGSTLDIELSAAESDNLLAVNRELQDGFAPTTATTYPLTGLAAAADVEIVLTNSYGTTTYVIHCVVGLPGIRGQS